VDNNRALIYILILQLSLSVFGQTPESNDTAIIDQLKKELFTATADHDSLQMARSLRHIGVENMFSSQYDSALNHLQKALKIAHALNHQKAIAAIYNNIAECYSKQGLREKALAAYDTMAIIYLSIPDSVSYAGMLINLAAEYQEMGENANALETALKATKIKEATGDSAHLAFFYIKVAELLESNQPESYRRWLLQAWHLSRTPEYTTFYTNLTIYNNMARMYRQDGNYERAIALYDSVYTIAKENGHHDGMEVGLSNLASIYAGLGETEKALQLYKKTLEISKKGQNVFRRTGHFINAGKLEISLKSFSNALPMLQQGYNLAKQYNFPEYQIESLEALSSVYQATDQWMKAFESLQQLNLIKDSIDGIKVKETLLELEQKYETERKQQQIELLEAKHQNSVKQQRILVILLFFSILLLSSLIWLIRIRNKKLKQEKILAEQKKEIYQLNQENLRLTLDQKNRELSSMAMQMAQKTGFLNDLKIQLTKSNPEAIRAHVKSIEHQIRQSSDWEAFRIHFEEVHPHFFRKLSENFPLLTSNEQKLCALLSMNLSSKEIASINNNTVPAVDKSRNRLRKKLGISPEVNLREYLLEISSNSISFKTS
jgi:tetratricopeptide (TPR) repeat protein/DNA-binding CsgD family transcriptional regulator